MNPSSNRNRMPALAGLVLLGAFAMGADKGGCGPIDIPPVSATQCALPADCTGLPHVMCLGDWQCLQGACYWKCGQVAPECTTAADCANHTTDVLCAGAWQCVDGACDFQCGVVPTDCQVDSDCPQGQHCELQPGCVGDAPSDPATGMPCQVKGTCQDDVVQTTCVVGGCSGELCLPEGSDLASPCWYLDWFRCLQYSTCGNFGEGGACGWQQTAEFLACMDGEACGAGGDCPEGYACVDGTCQKVVDPTGCHSDQDCATGQHCSVSDGDCQSDPNCPMCDVCYGTCVPDANPSECQADSDCREGYVCQLTTACPDCVYSDTPCKMPCQVSGVCVPKTAVDCTADSDCPEGQYCSLEACSEYQNCAGTDPATGTNCLCTGTCQPVVDPGSCQVDSDCPQGQRCLWTPGCQPCTCPDGSTDCACTDVCIPLDHGFCSTVCDTTQPEVCGNGVDDNCDGQVDEGCTSGCTSDADCASYETCLLIDYANGGASADAAIACCPAGAPCIPEMPPCWGGTCVLQAGRCWSDGDCSQNQACQGARICPDGALCLLADEPGKCVSTTRECQADSDCPVGQACNLSQVDPTTCCLPGATCLMIYLPCTGFCQSPDGVCWTDADCVPWQYCAITRCGTERCVGPYTCEYRPD